MADNLPGIRLIGSYFQRSAIYVFVIAFACVYYLINAPLLLSHWDLGWHLAAGDLIRDQGHIPVQDPWSFTSGGRQWFNLSWLWDVFASVLFQHANFGGLILFVVACGAVMAGYLASVCLSSGASAIAVCISVLSACLFYPAFAAAYPNIYLAASPNISTMLFSVIFYGECLKRTRRRFLLPVIMVLWANLHGGFLLGLIIVGVFCGVALLRRSIPGIIYILIFVAFELRYGGGACPIESRLLSWLFLFLGLYQFRYMSFFFIFSTVPLALHLDRLLPKQSNNFQIQRSSLVAGIILACALPLIYMQIDPALGLPQMLSEQDVLYLRTHFSHARILNHWNYGGILIFRTRGAIPVFVDGRASTAYPDALLRDYFKLVQSEFDETAWDTVLEKYQIDTVLWVKAHEELRRFLVERRGWKEAYAGSYASIYVKP